VAAAREQAARENRELHAKLAEANATCRRCDETTRRVAELEEALFRLRRLAVTRDDGEMTALIDEVSDAALRRWTDTTEGE